MDMDPMRYTIIREYYVPINISFRDFMFFVRTSYDPHSIDRYIEIAAPTSTMYLSMSSEEAKYVLGYLKNGLKGIEEFIKENMKGHLRESILKAMRDQKPEVDLYIHITVNRRISPHEEVADGINIRITNGRAKIEMILSDEKRTMKSTELTLNSDVEKYLILLASYSEALGNGDLRRAQPMLLNILEELEKDTEGSVELPTAMIHSIATETRNDTLYKLAKRGYRRRNAYLLKAEIADEMLKTGVPVLFERYTLEKGTIAVDSCFFLEKLARCLEVIK